MLRLKSVEPVRNPNIDPDEPFYDPSTVDVAFEGIVGGFAFCRFVMKLEQQPSDGELVAFAEEQLRRVVGILHAHFEQAAAPTPPGASSS